MLTLKEFNMLHTHDQEEYISNGTFLADREENGLVVRLYNLNSLYREVFYDAHTNKALRIKVFDTTKPLVPYLAHIKIKSAITIHNLHCG